MTSVDERTDLDRINRSHRHACRIWRGRAYAREGAVLSTRKNSVGLSYQENNNQNPIAVTAYSSRSRNYSADASCWKAGPDTRGGIALFSGVNIHSLDVGLRFTLATRVDLYKGYTLTKDLINGRFLSF